MSSKPTRGTKRTCQNNSCGARFYDLNNDPIACPICGSLYVIASSPLPTELVSTSDKPPKKAKNPEVVAKKILPEELQTETEGEDVLVEIEEVEDIPADDAETFLEEEEEEGGGDVSNIIGGPVAEGEEEA